LNINFDKFYAYKKSAKIKNWRSYDWQNMDFVTDKLVNVIAKFKINNKKEAGYYMLFINNKQNEDKFSGIKVESDIDKWGMLSIGESRDLQHRLNTFLTCAFTALDERLKGGYVAGNKFYYLQLSKILNKEDLWISFITIDKLKQLTIIPHDLPEYLVSCIIKKVEADFLKSFKDMYHSLPLLNQRLISNKITEQFIKSKHQLFIKANNKI